MDTENATPVWYLAYGSNMLLSVMERRGMTILGIQNVVVDSQILNFDVFGVPFTEPAMAGIAERPAVHEGPVLHGVAYLLSEADYRRLIVSEGAGIAYRDVVIEARVLDNEDRSELDQGRLVNRRVPVEGLLRTRTLVPRYPFRPNALPSTRYLNLLIDGAVQRNLPVAYLEYLKSLPHYTKKVTPVQAFGVWLFLSTWMPALKFMMSRIKAKADDHGHVPLWMGGLVNFAFRSMWWYHDYIHRNIWICDGGRRVKAASG